MEAKFENLTISDKPLSNSNSAADIQEDNILAYIQGDKKKYELNVNAKEFVPRFTSESPNQSSESGQTNPEQSATPRTLLSGKNGDDSYKPIFMNGMTEKFIQGPYMGNGRDAEIPYIRYFANGQTLDFFNKKYFSNGNSGEVVFKPYEGNNEQIPESYPGPLFANGFSDNIFKPPFINALVSDILCRQYLSYLWPKMSPQYIPPRRGSGKTQYNNTTNQRSYMRPEQLRGAIPTKGISKTSPANGSQEELYDEDNSVNVTINEPVSSDSSDLEISVDRKNFNNSEDQETESANFHKKSILIESPKDKEPKDKCVNVASTNVTLGKCSLTDIQEDDKLQINGCSIMDKSKELLLTERQSPFLDSIAKAENITPPEMNRDSSISNPSGSETFSDASSSLSDRDQDMLNPVIEKSREEMFFQNARSATHS